MNNAKKTILSDTEKSLIDGLRAFGVHKDQVIPLMIALQDKEEGMLELMEYMATYQPTAHEIIKKSVEIATREPQSASKNLHF